MLRVQIDSSLIFSPQVAFLSEDLGIDLFAARRAVVTLFLSAMDLHYHEKTITEHPEFIKTMCGLDGKAWVVVGSLRKSGILKGRLHNYTLACDGIHIGEV